MYLPGRSPCCFPFAPLEPCSRKLVHVSDYLLLGPEPVAFSLKFR